MSIVGALVIGESAVRAGLIGAPMVIIVALTALCSFVLPSLYGPIAILRFAFIILGGSLGLYGVMLGACLLLVSIAAMNIQSIPFLAPISPFSIKAMRDVVCPRHLDQAVEGHLHRAGASRLQNREGQRGSGQVTRPALLGKKDDERL